LIHIPLFIDNETAENTRCAIRLLLFIPIFGHFTSRPDGLLSAISSDKSGHSHDELTEIYLSYAGKYRRLANLFVSELATHSEGL
jgi:hypothetical protein